MPLAQSQPDGVTAESLIRILEQRRGSSCPSCQAAVCHHQVLMSVYMGFQDAPRCLRCMAVSLSAPALELRDRLVRVLQQRDCYREAWEWANRDEGLSDAVPPTCLRGA